MPSLRRIATVTAFALAGTPLFLDAFAGHVDVPAAVDAADVACRTSIPDSASFTAEQQVALRSLDGYPVSFPDGPPVAGLPVTFHDADGTTVTLGYDDAVDVYAAAGISAASPVYLDAAGSWVLRDGATLPAPTAAQSEYYTQAGIAPTAVLAEADAVGADCEAAGADADGPTADEAAEVDDTGTKVLVTLSDRPGEQVWADAPNGPGGPIHGPEGYIPVTSEGGSVTWTPVESLSPGAQAFLDYMEQNPGASQGEWDAVRAEQGYDEADFYHQNPGASAADFERQQAEIEYYQANPDCGSTCYQDFLAQYDQ